MASLRLVLKASPTLFDTKSALLEVLSFCLHCLDYPARVSVIEPGFFRTDITNMDRLEVDL